MKTVYFARHAKSSWDQPELSDEQRPLIGKGRKRTEKVIKHLLASNTKPDLIISSHAVRAFETAKMLAGGLSYPVDGIKTDRRLYFYEKDDILDILYELPGDISSVMLVSHNPEITNISNYFLFEKIDYMPTSGVVGFRFDTDDWTMITNVSRTVISMAFPKLL